MHLTNDQIEAVKNNEPVRVYTPESGEVFVISRALYERVAQALLEDDEEDRKFQKAWLKLAHQGLVAALHDDDN